MNWIESNRKQHFVGIFIVSLFGTLLMGIGCIAGMEFKDCHHDKLNAGKPIKRWNWRCWDWQDCLAGALGGIAATAIQLLIIVLITQT